LCVSAWAERLGIAAPLLAWRLKRWPIDKAMSSAVMTREQHAVARRSHFLKYRGREQCVESWAREVGISSGCISHRLKLGWSVERALSVPPRLKRKVEV
jgi:hypothetical protein